VRKDLALELVNDVENQLPLAVVVDGVGELT